MQRPVELLAQGPQQRGRPEDVIPPWAEEERVGRVLREQVAARRTEVLQVASFDGAVGRPRRIKDPLLDDGGKLAPAPK